MDKDLSNFKIRHPAKYSDCLIDIFYEELKSTNNVVDPFAGVGKIGLIKEKGYKGKVYANELEPEWIRDNKYNCDYLTFQDAEFLDYENSFFDAICTSPTYGNRMADHHEAKDNSVRNTYTHCLGHKLSNGNTGCLQWGEAYKEKHLKIYSHLISLLKEKGIFILNISDHIRKGKIIKVSDWHYETLESLGLKCVKKIKIPTPRLKFGANSNLRVEYENVFVFVKI